MAADLTVGNQIVIFGKYPLFKAIFQSPLDFPIERMIGFDMGEEAIQFTEGHENRDN